MGHPSLFLYPPVGTRTQPAPRKQKKAGISSCSLRTQTRGRTGMDVTPLVFETSASTDSAIWATRFPFAIAKVVVFLNIAKLSDCFL